MVGWPGRVGEVGAEVVVMMVVVEVCASAALADSRLASSSVIFAMRFRTS